MGSICIQRLRIWGGNRYSWPIRSITSSPSCTHSFCNALNPYIFTLPLLKFEWGIPTTIQRPSPLIATSNPKSTATLALNRCQRPWLSLVTEGVWRRSQGESRSWIPIPLPLECRTPTGSLPIPSSNIELKSRGLTLQRHLVFQKSKFLVGQPKHDEKLQGVAHWTNRDLPPIASQNMEMHWTCIVRLHQPLRSRIHRRYLWFLRYRISIPWIIHHWHGSLYKPKLDKCGYYYQDHVCME